MGGGRGGFAPRVCLVRSSEASRERFSLQLWILKDIMTVRKGLDISSVSLRIVYEIGFVYLDAMAGIHVLDNSALSTISYLTPSPMCSLPHIMSRSLCQANFGEGFVILLSSSVVAVLGILRLVACCGYGQARVESEDVPKQDDAILSYCSSCSSATRWLPGKGMHFTAGFML